MFKVGDKVFRYKIKSMSLDSCFKEGIIVRTTPLWIWFNGKYHHKSRVLHATNLNKLLWSIE